MWGMPTAAKKIIGLGLVIIASLLVCVSPSLAVVHIAKPRLEKKVLDRTLRQMIEDVSLASHQGCGVASYDVASSVCHQGLLHDEETGLVYNRARMLHPRLGRFMQRDPLGYVDGFNLYEYVRSSPLGFVDPLGLQGEPFGGFILNAVVKAPGAAKDVISDTAKEVALPVGFHLGLVDEADLLAESGLAQAVAARSVQGQGDVRIAAGLGLDVARHANPESLGQRIAFEFVAGLVTRDSDRSSRAIAEGVLTLSPFVASKGSTIFGRGVKVVRGPCQVGRVARGSVVTRGMPQSFDVASTFRNLRFREITVQSGTRLDRAFEQGVNRPVGSFATRGATANRLTSTQTAIDELGLRGTSDVRPNRVTALEFTRPTRVKVGLIEGGGKRSIQYVVDPADIMSGALRRVPGSTRTLD